MRGNILVLGLAASLALGIAPRANAQRTVNRVIAIQNTTLGDGNSSNAYGNAPPAPVERGQLLNSYNRDANRVYVVVESPGGTSPANARQRTWGWVDASAVVPVDRAAAYFTDCLKKDPKDAGAYFGRASAAAAEGQNDRVIADCGELLRLDPKSAAGYFLRGVAWQAKGNNEKAIADYGDVVRLDPRRAEAFRLRGDLYFKQKKYTEAIADYTQLLKFGGNQADAYYSRAVARLEQKEYRKSLDDLNEILAVQPETAMAYRVRGMVWCRLGDFDRAEDDFAESLRARRIQAAQWNRQGWNFLWQGEGASAVYYFREFLKLYDDSVEDWLDLADCHASQGDLDRAIADCGEALDVDPSSVRALQQRGQYRLEKKQFAPAMADFDAALRLDPKLVADHRVNRGNCRCMMGQYDAAAADFEEAARKEPESVHACNALAWFLATCDDARHRDGKRAVALATKACEAGQWESSACIDTLAAGCAEAGKFDDAVRWQQKAVDLATPASKPRMAERLELYKARKPYREIVMPETTARVKSGK